MTQPEQKKNKINEAGRKEARKEKKIIVAGGGAEKVREESVTQ